jgi:hypothetical protein
LLVLKFFKDEKYMRYREIVFGLIVILILFISIPFTFFENMFTLKLHGNMYINDKMAEYTFYPYREACKYVRENIKPGEEVVSVMPRIAEFYIDRDIWSLRHVRLNTNRFNVADEFIEDETVYENSLINHPSFLNFIQTHRSGWVILDTRVYTAVAGATRDFIFDKMDLHILGSIPIGRIFTLYWDTSTISKKPRPLLWLYGSNIMGMVSVGDEINILDSNTTVRLTVIYSGVEKPDEAICIVGNEFGYLPQNLGLGKVDTVNSYLRAAEFMRTGTIEFTYNTDCGDPTGGFFIHDVVLETMDDR